MCKEWIVSSCFFHVVLLSFVRTLRLASSAGDAGTLRAAGRPGGTSPADSQETSSSSPKPVEGAKQSGTTPPPVAAAGHQRLSSIGMHPMPSVGDLYLLQII